MHNQRKFFSYSERVNFVLVFSLFFSWLLSFPFEGKLLYSLTEEYGLNTQIYVFGSVIAHFLGLFLSGFLIKNILNAKKLMKLTVLFCIATSLLFLTKPSVLWMIMLFVASFLLGGCVACCGFFLRSFEKSERLKILADGLITVNILLIFLTFINVVVSLKASILTSLLFLGAAYLFAGRLSITDYSRVEQVSEEPAANIRKPLLFLCIFIFIITIDSGLMYRVQGAAFAHLTWLSSWYWPVPYIAALLVIRFLPPKINRTDILYGAAAMIGFSYIAFMMLDRSAASYLIVNTLIMAACGIYDLFWWSILGEMLTPNINPAFIFGIGLSSNVLGVLSGGLIGTALMTYRNGSSNSSMFALGIVFITLILLAPLHRSLTKALSDHEFLSVFTHLEPQEKTCAISRFAMKETLTERENEIASLLLMGKSYKVMASELHVSENTIKTHVKNVYAKAGVHNRTELINLFLNAQQDTI